MPDDRTGGNTVFSAAILVTPKQRETDVYDRKTLFDAVSLDGFTTTTA